MRIFAWLPAMAVAVAACFVAPDAQAQEWLHWKQASVQQGDPAKRIVPSKPHAPVRASIPAAMPAMPSGPTITISETPSATLVAITAPVHSTPAPADTPLPLAMAAIDAIASTALPEPLAATHPASAVVAGSTASIATTAISTACGDCPTPSELAATPGGAAPSTINSGDSEIQSEIKRQLLQGH